MNRRLAVLAGIGAMLGPGVLLLQVKLRIIESLYGEPWLPWLRSPQLQDLIQRPLGSPWSTMFWAAACSILALGGAALGLICLWARERVASTTARISIGILSAALLGPGVNHVVGAALFETLGRLGGWYREDFVQRCLPLSKAETDAYGIMQLIWLAAASCAPIVTGLLAHAGISRSPPRGSGASDGRILRMR
jgi:hypothetical protein